MKNKRVAAYCRVSTDSEQQESSFENQKSYFEREIEKVKGVELYHIYADKGVSGTKLNRPEFDKMLCDAGLMYKDLSETIKKGWSKEQEGVGRIKGGIWIAVPGKEPLFDEIWIKNTSRFARNVTSVDIINKLNDKGVIIRFIEQNINTGDETGALVLHIMQSLDQSESEGKSSKVKWGQEESRRKGKIFTHGDIYGYHYIKEENRLVAIPEEAEVVKQIFDWYAEGKGFRVIINLLNAKGITTRSGKPFGKTQVNRIISNEKYAGLNNSGKYTTGKVLHTHYPTVREDYTVAETDRIEPIVTKELFYQCKKIKDSKQDVYNQRGQNKGFRKYSGLVYCYKCGEPYIGNVDKGRLFYNCKMKKNKGTAACDNLNVTEERLDRYFQWLFDNYLNSVAVFLNFTYFYTSEKLLSLVGEALYPKIDNTIEPRLKEEQERLLKVLDRYENASDEVKAVYQKKLDELEARVTDLQVQFNNQGKSQENLYREICEYYYTVQVQAENLVRKPTSIKEMIERCIDRVYVEDTYIFCTFKGLEDPVNGFCYSLASKYTLWRTIYKNYLDEQGRVMPASGDLKNGEVEMVSPESEVPGKSEFDLVFERIPDSIKQDVRSQVEHEIYGT